MHKGRTLLDRQSHIVSFDDARRNGRERDAARVSTGPSRRNPARVAQGSSRVSMPRSSGRRAVPPANRAFDESFTAPRFEGSRGRGFARADRVGAVVTTRAARDRSDEGSAADAPASATVFERLSMKAARAKKARAKNKADRSFMQQYGSSDAARASAEAAGPRAAVYKGEMGTQHRKAARMQDAGAARGGRSSQPSPKKDRSRHPVLVAGAAAMVCVLFCGAFLYGPAQQYYQEIRERDRLAAEYAAIEQRNEAIQNEVDSLSTDAGVEDRARTEFGWVKSDENVATVSGIDVEDTSSFTANIVPGSVKAPDTWYSDVLDPFFGVE